MQRIAAIFTGLVFAAVIGGLLARKGALPGSSLPALEPTAAPVLPPLVDPLGAARDAAADRADRALLSIVDPAGAPVAGAALVVRCGASTIWAFTNAEGNATLEGLSAGKSLLAVIAFPHPALEIEIEPSREATRIVLPPAATLPPPLPDIARSNFEGRLAWSGPENPAGYEVLLLPLSPASELGGTLPRSVACDEQGRFKLEGLAHGRYRLKVLPPWASGGTWPDLTTGSARELDFRGASSELVIELARGRIEGEVHDEMGRALEGALVLMNEVANDAHLWPPCSTGPDGHFQFLDVPPGKYRVLCRAGEGGSTIEELTVEPGALAWADLPAFPARKRP